LDNVKPLLNEFEYEIQLEIKTKFDFYQNSFSTVKKLTKLPTNHQRVIFISYICCLKIKTHDLSNVCLHFQNDDFTHLNEDFVSSENTCQDPNYSSEEWTDVRIYILLLCK